jgi:hypothetical protein
MPPRIEPSRKPTTPDNALDKQTGAASPNH